MTTIKEIQLTLQNLLKKTITQTEIGKALGTGRSNINFRLKNNSKVKIEEIKKLEDYFKVNLFDIPDGGFTNPNQFVDGEGFENSTEIINRINEFRNNKNIDIEEFCKKMSLEPYLCLKYEEPSNLSLRYVQKISENFNISLDWLINGDKNNNEDDDIIEIERIEGIRPECGAGSDIIVDAHIEPFRISRHSILEYIRCSSPENLKTFRASGDSMEDKISDGDWLLVDIGRRDASVSGVYIFLANGLCRCKRLNMTLDGRLEVKSDNPKYAMEVVGPNNNIEINIIGRVLNNLSKGL